MADQQRLAKESEIQRLSKELETVAEVIHSNLAAYKNRTNYMRGLIVDVYVNDDSYQILRCDNDHDTKILSKVKAHIEKHGISMNADRRWQVNSWDYKTEKLCGFTIFNEKNKKYDLCKYYDKPFKMANNFKEHLYAILKEENIIQVVFMSAVVILLIPSILILAITKNISLFISVTFLAFVCFIILANLTIAAGLSYRDMYVYNKNSAKRNMYYDIMGKNNLNTYVELVDELMKIERGIILESKYGAV